MIEARTGLRSLGVVTWLDQARDLPKEDIAGSGGAGAGRPGRTAGRSRVAVPRLPRLANFDDLDPLAAEPEVDLRMLEPGEPLPATTDLVLLPGSKSTLADLAALRRAGLGHRHPGPCPARRLGAGPVRRLPDARPQHRRPARPRGAARRRRPGLGLLEVDTVLEPAKVLALARTALELATGEPVRGYEIHMGRTDGPGPAAADAAPATARPTAP